MPSSEPTGELVARARSYRNNLGDWRDSASTEGWLMEALAAWEPVIEVGAMSEEPAGLPSLPHLANSSRLSWGQMR